MEKRKQFTFYRSYYESLKNLPEDCIAPTVMAMCAYALDEEETTLSGVPASIFALIRPTLDTGRAKASSRLGKTNEQQNKNKPARKSQQSGKEKEEEGEKEREKEDDSLPPIAPRGVAFDRFWQAYPKKVGKQAAWKAFEKVKVPVESLLSAIERQKRGSQWSRDDGQYIPNPATWLNQGRWEDEVERKEGGNGLGSNSGNAAGEGRFANIPGCINLE